VRHFGRQLQFDCEGDEMKNKKLISNTAEIAEPKNGKVTSTNGVKAATKAKAGAGSIAQNMLPDDYRPSEDEDFMNPLQLLYFQKKLESWKAELLDDASGTITGLSQENLHQPDQMDRAQIESNAALDLRTRDRERKLLQKIEAALRRIDDGSYGYCVETDEPINLRRLEARPIASLSLHAQELHERMERVHRDD
jgi:DnaK suppressor protein